MQKKRKKTREKSVLIFDRNTDVASDFVDTTIMGRSKKPVCYYIKETKSFYTPQCLAKTLTIITFLLCQVQKCLILELPIKISGSYKQPNLRHCKMVYETKSFHRKSLCSPLRFRNFRYPKLFYTQKGFSTK